MKGEESTRVSVDIYGIKYKLKGDSSSADMKKIADYVDEQMHAVAKAHPTLDTPKLAVLVAVNAVDEHFKIREQLNLQQHNEQKAAALNAELAKLRAENQKLRTAYDVELAQIQAKHRAELAELQVSVQKDSKLQEECNKLQTEYSLLKEEYTKLQSEYNEWIQLVGSDHPGSD